MHMHVNSINGISINGISINGISINGITINGRFINVIAIDSGGMRGRYVLSG